MWLAARGWGEAATGTAGTVSVAVPLCTLHVCARAGAALPIGWLGDRPSKLGVLGVGCGPARVPLNQHFRKCRLVPPIIPASGARATDWASFGSC
jgi:hypothetical protein